MEVLNLTLRVINLNNTEELSDILGCDEEYIQELKNDGYDLSVSAWEDGYMVDSHVMDLFPELYSISGLDEPSEGDMYYNGKLSISELVDKLVSMGFDTQVG